jgi:hypothetical protein
MLHQIYILYSIQLNSIYLCAKLNSPEANYKVSTGKKMGRVRSKKVNENNVLIKIKKTLIRHFFFSVVQQRG